MKKRLFTDMRVVPSDALLRKQLGDGMQFYESILSVSGSFRRQWQFSRGNGWLLRVDDTRKALYYLIAFEDGIEISLTVRDAERQEFLNNPAYESIWPALEAGTRYPEGFALRFEVQKASDCRFVSEFIKGLIELRRPALEALRKKATASRATRSVPRGPKKDGARAPRPEMKS